MTSEGRDFCASHPTQRATSAKGVAAIFIIFNSSSHQYMKNICEENLRKKSLGALEKCLYVNSESLQISVALYYLLFRPLILLYVSYGYIDADNHLLVLILFVLPKFYPILSSLTHFNTMPFSNFVYCEGL